MSSGVIENRIEEGPIWGEGQKDVFWMLGGAVGGMVVGLTVHHRRYGEDIDQAREISGQVIDLKDEKEVLESAKDSLNNQQNVLSRYGIEIEASAGEITEAIASVDGKIASLNNQKNDPGMELSMGFAFVPMALALGAVGLWRARRYKRLQAQNQEKAS